MSTVSPLRAGGATATRAATSGERERAGGREPADGGHRPTVVPTRARTASATSRSRTFPSRGRVASLATPCGCSSPAPPGSPAATSPPTARASATRSTRSRTGSTSATARPSPRRCATSAPDAVAHLAGASSVGASFADPLGTWDVNLGGTLALLEALREAAPEARALIVSSGEVHGRVAPEDLPVGPDTPMRPLSPYGASKAAADLAAGQYRASYGLPAHARARLQPRRPRPGPALRAAQRRPPDRAGRARGARARGGAGRQRRHPARLHRRARHGPRLRS